MDVPALIPVEQMSAAAQWLNATFQNFDYKILEFYHNLHAGSMGPFFDVFNKYFTRLGDGGYFVLAIGLILLLFKKSRKIGMGMIGGVIIGALFTNVAIKNVVARPRPYVSTQTFQDWWLAVGHGLESEYSFPSGHTTSVAAAMWPVFLNCRKKVSWLVFLFVIAIGATRNYIMVHFPSDILGGIIVGSVAGILSYCLVKLLYDKVFIKGKLGNVIMTKDIRDLLKKEKAA